MDSELIQLRDLCPYVTPADDPRYVVLGDKYVDELVALLESVRGRRCLPAHTLECYQYVRVLVDAVAEIEGSQANPANSFRD